MGIWKSQIPNCATIVCVTKNVKDLLLMEKIFYFFSSQKIAFGVDIFWFHNLFKASARELKDLNFFVELTFFLEFCLLCFLWKKRNEFLKFLFRTQMNRIELFNTVKPELTTTSE